MNKDLNNVVFDIDLNKRIQQNVESYDEQNTNVFFSLLKLIERNVQI